MKTKVFTAITLAVIFCVFTYFHCSHSKPPLTIAIAGEWKVDSVYSIYEVTDSMRQEITAKGINEKKKRFLFNTDSSLLRLSLVDSSSGKYYVRDGDLYIDYSNGVPPYLLQVISDSSFRFYYKDSMMIIMKRK